MILNKGISKKLINKSFRRKKKRSFLKENGIEIDERFF